MNQDFSTNTTKWTQPVNYLFAWILLPVTLGIIAWTASIPALYILGLQGIYGVGLLLNLGINYCFKHNKLYDFLNSKGLLSEEQHQKSEMGIRFYLIKIAQILNIASFVACAVLMPQVTTVNFLLLGLGMVVSQTLTTCLSDYIYQNHFKAFLERFYPEELNKPENTFQDNGLGWKLAFLCAIVGGVLVASASVLAINIGTMVTAGIPGFLMVAGFMFFSFATSVGYSSTARMKAEHYSNLFVERLINRDISLQGIRSNIITRPNFFDPGGFVETNVAVMDLLRSKLFLFAIASCAISISTFGLGSVALIASLQILGGATFVLQNWQNKQSDQIEKRVNAMMDERLSSDAQIKKYKNLENRGIFGWTFDSLSKLVNGAEDMEVNDDRARSQQNLLCRPG